MNLFNPGTRSYRKKIRNFYDATHSLSLSLSLSLSQSFHHSLPMEKGVVLLTKETEREGEFWRW